MNTVPDSAPPEVSRWTLIRDVAVFQVKLIVDGLRDLLLVPTSFIVGIISLLSGEGGKSGPQFYQLLLWGKQTEKWIGLFNAVKRSPDCGNIAPQFADQGMDEIVDRFETFVVQEYKSGKLSAQAREQLDKLLKSMRRKNRET